MILEAIKFVEEFEKETTLQNIREEWRGKEICYN